MTEHSSTPALSANGAHELTPFDLIKTAAVSNTALVIVSDIVNNIVHSFWFKPPIVQHFNTDSNRLMATYSNSNQHVVSTRIFHLDNGFARLSNWLLAGAIILLALSASAQTGQYSADSKAAQHRRWWAPGEGRIFPMMADYENITGIGRVLNVGGPTATQDHAFFEPIGSNGRACISCHQPADGMSLSIATIRQRWDETEGRDPLFAAIDGANCPHLPMEKESSHSLLLERGLFRVFRPWPPVDAFGNRVEPEFTIEVVRDPTGCNTHPLYGLHSANPHISVYRRPRPVANLKYLTGVGFPFEGKRGLPLPRDPETGDYVSGNLMADGRALTLKAQAQDAAKTHLELRGELSDSQLQQILSFEQQLYFAQVRDITGGDLQADGATGGPESLATDKAAQLNSNASRPMWDEYQTWLTDWTSNGESLNSGSTPHAGGPTTPEQQAFRDSVARGVDFFRNTTFLISDNSGITSMSFGNPVRNDCNFCHNMYRTGNDTAPGQIDLGTTNQPYADPDPDLPLFKLTCKEGKDPHPHLGKVVYTTDPGYALTTGLCIDIGKITAQQMRGMAARAPFFANGSAETIRDVVDFYDRRYNMHLTEQQKQDLTNLLRVL